MKNFSKYLTGERLFGDDFGRDEIERWYEDEKDAYFSLRSGIPQSGRYEYGALNEYHFFRHLIDIRFAHCVVLGSADGSDVKPLSNQVDQFICIEPAKEWWRDEIGGAPATYKEPHVDGHLDIADTSIDLAISFGVLHHIPNVSFVLGEMARILKPGGYLLLREPISSMGDWRNPRPGLTRNERGLPIGWLVERTAAMGLEVERKAFCMFAPFGPLFRQLRMKPYANNLFTRIDSSACRLFRWNMNYFRDDILKKVAPGAVAMILRKPRM